MSYNLIFIADLDSPPHLQYIYMLRFILSDDSGMLMANIWREEAVRSFLYIVGLMDSIFLPFFTFYLPVYSCSVFQIHNIIIDLFID